MEYCKLGNTSYLVSKICFGALTIGPLGAYLPIKEGAAVIRKALELGVNFIDTAQYYRTYPYIEEALKDWTKPVIISSKTYGQTIEEVDEAVEEARRQLKRDQIEIFMLHEQKDGQTLAANRPLLQYLQKLKAQGRIGAVGISTHNVSAAALAAEMDEIDVIHPLINKMGIGTNGGTVEEMMAAAQKAHDNGKGVYGMKAIGGGSLMNQAQEMLQWAFSRPFFDAVAVGMKDIAEVATNVGWLAGENPPQAELIKNIPHKLAFDDCWACGNCVKKCGQKALTMGDDFVIWHPERCIYCGYCIPACPYFFISIV